MKKKKRNVLIQYHDPFVFIVLLLVFYIYMCVYIRIYYTRVYTVYWGRKTAP